MKKFLLASLFFSIFLMGSQLHAQFYAGANLGYGVPFTPEPFGLTYDEANSTITNQYKNAGQGFRVSVQPGFMFTENFGFELGAYYFASPEILVQDTINGQSFYNTYTNAWHLRVTPALVFMAGDGDITPYAKVGLCIPVAGSVTARRESNDPLLVNSQFAILNYENDGGEMITADRFDLEAEFKGQFSIGFESVAGVKYSINDNLSVFGELAFTALRIRRATSEVKKGIATMSNGEEYNMLPLLSLGGVYQYTEFADEVDLDEISQAMQDAQIRTDVILPNGAPFPLVSDYGTSADKSHKILASDGAYSTIGINLGVRFAF